MERKAHEEFLCITRKWKKARESKRKQEKARAICIRPKTFPKPIQNTSKSNPNFTPNPSQERPKSAPRAIQVGESVSPTWMAPQERPKRVPRAPQERPKASKSSQKPPKNLPKCSLNRPKIENSSLQLPIPFFLLLFCKFVSFWMHFQKLKTSKISILPRENAYFH